MSSTSNSIQDPTTNSSVEIGTNALPDEKSVLQMRIAEQLENQHFLNQLIDLNKKSEQELLKNKSPTKLFHLFIKFMMNMLDEEDAKFCQMINNQEKKDSKEEDKVNGNGRNGMENEGQEGNIPNSLCEGSSTEIPTVDKDDRKTNVGPIIGLIFNYLGLRAKKMEKEKDGENIIEDGDENCSEADVMDSTDNSDDKDFPAIANTNIILIPGFTILALMLKELKTKNQQNDQLLSIMNKFQNTQEEILDTLKVANTFAKVKWNTSKEKLEVEKEKLEVEKEKLRLLTALVASKSSPAVKAVSYLA